MKKIFLSVILLLLGSNIFAASFSYVEYVEVIRSEPIYRTITKRIPYQECWYEEVPVEHSYNGGIDDNVGALIGGVAGGIIGHQIGEGGGKTAATVGGAIIGTLVGKNLSKKSDAYIERGYKKVKRCRTRYEERQERIQRGYRNYAFYNGKKIVKFSKRPLKRLKINVTVSY